MAGGRAVFDKINILASYLSRETSICFQELLKALRGTFMALRICRRNLTLKILLDHHNVKPSPM